MKGTLTPTRQLAMLATFQLPDAAHGAFEVFEAEGGVLEEALACRGRPTAGMVTLE
jgi:hypothetical protein